MTAIYNEKTSNILKKNLQVASTFQQQLVTEESTMGRQRSPAEAREQEQELV